MEQRAEMLNKMKLGINATPQGIVDRIHRSSKPDVSLNAVSYLRSRPERTEIAIENDIVGEEDEDTAALVRDEVDTDRGASEQENTSSVEPEISKPYVISLDNVAFRFC